MSEGRDRELGMGRKITRRDFLDGVALTVGGAAFAGPLALVTTDGRYPGSVGASGTDRGEADGGGIKPLHEGLPGYPPGLTGLRGDQAQVFEFAHKLRDG